ncbi:MAG: MgtC/SapB family protein [Chitinophagaceae bacterium]
MGYEIMLRFLLAILWGGIVGAEREYHSKSAGFRTMIMISVGACFFTMMSMYIGNPGNMDRIASNIVTGIGFLGAGVIFRGENRVNGITTAATIWAVAAVGMGIGSGYYWTSAYASVLIIFILAILPYFETIIDRSNQTKSYSIQIPYAVDSLEKYEEIMRQCKLRFKITKQLKHSDAITISWQVHGPAKNHERFASLLRQDTSILHFEF